MGTFAYNQIHTAITMLWTYGRDKESLIKLKQFFYRCAKMEMMEILLQNLLLLRTTVSPPLHDKFPIVNSFSKASFIVVLLKAWSFSLSAKAIERSEEIIEQMNASNVKPDMRSYTTLISCYGRSTQRGAPQKADKVLRYMDSLYDQGILKEGPSYHTYSSLRKAWEVSNEPNKNNAIALLDKEINDRFHSDEMFKN